MATFASFDGLSLHYDDRGDGFPTVLLHGFAASSHINWEQPGVVGALLDLGRRVVTLDARGHGLSDKPHEAGAYANDAMSLDVSALADHLELDLFDLVGYSMGARTAASVAAAEPRVRSVVLGGLGAAFAKRPVSERASIAHALEHGDTPDDGEIAKGFRRFAETTGADVHALAAVQRGNPSLATVNLSAIRVPTLFVTGTGDDLVGDPEPLAERVENASVVRCPGDHLSAVAQPEFVTAIVDFLRDQES